VSEPEIVTLSRCIERILAVLIYGCSLGFGWNLFRVGVVADQEGQLSVANWKITLKKVGPGVFFALFGVIGLINSVRAPLQMGPLSPAVLSPTNQSAVSAQSFSYEASGLTAHNTDEIKAINTLESLWERHPPATTSAAEQQSEKTAFEILQKRKEQILSEAFGPNFDHYLQIRSSLRDHPEVLDRLNSQERDEYSRIDGVATELLSDSDKR
jgi:hypothetical protein